MNVHTGFLSCGCGSEEPYDRCLGDVPILVIAQRLVEREVGVEWAIGDRGEGHDIGVVREDHHDELGGGHHIVL